jgi:general secretion pathway protein G
MKQNSSRRAFTLIEMLIVVAIIGILASIVLIGLGPVQRQGRDARRQADLREVQNALELYYNKCGHYPGTTDCATVAAAGEVEWSDLSTVLVGSAIGVNQIPTDPSGGQTYRYATNTGGTTYVLEADLENPSNPALKSSLLPPEIDSAGSIDCKRQQYCISL